MNFRRFIYLFIYIYIYYIYDGISRNFVAQLWKRVVDVRQSNCHYIQQFSYYATGSQNIKNIYLRQSSYNNHHTIVIRYNTPFSYCRHKIL